MKMSPMPPERDGTKMTDYEKKRLLEKQGIWTERSRVRAFYHFG